MKILVVGDVVGRPGRDTLKLFLDKNKNKVTEFPVFVDTANMKGFSKFKLWISALGASIKSPDSKGNYPIFTL